MSEITLLEPVWKCNAQKILIFNWDPFLDMAIIFVSKMGGHCKRWLEKNEINPFFLQSQRSGNPTSPIQEDSDSPFPRRGLRMPGGRQDGCRHRGKEGHVLPSCH